MKCLLLTRESRTQRYCANRLFEEGFLAGTIIEEGQSVRSESVSGGLFTNIFGKMANTIRSPMRSLNILRNRACHDAYYGYREYHDNRILGDQDKSFHSESLLVGSVNTETCREWMVSCNPDLVFVFGTGLIGDSIINAIGCPFVNMHWGWSPLYRGEGIVSALAENDMEHLGVTVHLLDDSIDGGAILGQKGVEIDSKDNFYSIGVKMAVAGTELFIDICKVIAAGEKLVGEVQKLGVGKVYTGAFMDAHPEMFVRAWSNLKKRHRRNDS